MWGCFGKPWDDGMGFRLLRLIHRPHIGTYLKNHFPYQKWYKLTYKMVMMSHESMAPARRTGACLLRHGASEDFAGLHPQGAAAQRRGCDEPVLGGSSHESYRTSLKCTKKLC